MPLTEPEAETSNDFSCAGCAIDLVTQIASRYQITSINILLKACKAAVQRTELGVAVLGRFKAGKSSFLNHLIGREILPVGVVPVTSVITELAWARQERITARFLDGHEELVHSGELASFITEAKNPENHKAVDRVVILVPDLTGYRGLRLIDTPGLDSAFAHNADVSLNWVPNVDVALVTVGVDLPLSQQDIALIRRLFGYTSRVCVLLTKIDVMSEREQTEVLEFVRTQLNRNFQEAIDVFPYSTRGGYEWTRQILEELFFVPTLSGMRQQRESILNRKVSTLVRECGEYVRLRLTSAETVGSERQRLRQLVFADNHTTADAILELRLVTRHAVSGARAYIEQALKPSENRIREALSSRLRVEFSTWNLSFGKLLVRFEKWLSDHMLREISDESERHKSDFVKPLHDLQRQYARILQAFRDRISERTLEMFGVALRTTEAEIEVASPKRPDIRIGRIFDHNWELLSPILPTRLLRGAIRRRFAFRVEEETYTNLSRLTAQWLDIVSAMAHQMQKEAEGRIEDLVVTIDRLTGSPSVEIEQIRLDLRALEDFGLNQRNQL